MGKKMLIKNERTSEYKYGFKVWLKNGEKYVDFFYNLEGIKEMQKKLIAGGEVFEIQIVNEKLEVEKINI